MTEPSGSSLLRLIDHGQSYWLDNLTRGMIEDGTLERRVREEGLRGVTSNPSIFQKAITGGSEYDDQIDDLMERRLPVSRIYERLVVDDIRRACDVLRPVYDESGGTDGFVSLEVSPYLAHDTEGSVEEALRLHGAVDRPNVFIKIPGTEAGVPAIEELLYRGVNVNVTLLFSIDAYESVARAYLRAMERRREEGKSLEDVASVASFFLSRIDVLVDAVLGHRIQPGAAGDEISALLGRAGIANAKLAYRRFRKLFGGERWESLEEAGARVQRMLWASTSTKDPLYSDVRYVEPLIGPHTVNTLPERTIRAFDDHGTVATTVEDGVDEARRVMERLGEAGIDFEGVTGQLLHEGVRKFIDPYDSLMATLADRYERHAGWPSAGQAVVLREDEGSDVEDTLDSLARRQFARRLDGRDPALWSDDPAVREGVSRRLGWLDLPDAFADRLDEIDSFADGVRPPEFEHVLLLGMGGSCQAARAVEGVFGATDGRPGLTVLDDTSPDAVREFERSLDLERTLVLVASKSGTTVETRALYRYFRSRIEDLVGSGEAGDRFAAVTDPGTPLAREARDRGFRALFENPADVGGRYSALSFFGLVPAALLGVDTGELLRRAGDLRRWHDGSVPPGANPAIRLGAAVGALAREGRDKLTLVTSDRLEPFTDWLEQLVAESTGKEGRGVVPVVGEELEAPGAYGDDRLFVHMRLRDDEDLDATRRLEKLETAGHPVLRVQLRDVVDLGAEFLRWEVAVATAGRILGVNPFDEPDVEASKRATEELLERLAAEGSLPAEEPLARGEHLELYAEAGAGWLGAAAPGGTVDEVLSAALGSVGPGDYLALLSFCRPTSERRAALQALRTRLRDRLGVATTLSHGPAYLHSTGQLHKGGPDRAAFLMITGDARESVDVPGAPYGFGQLRAAQALGDERALRERDRRVLRLHLGSDVEAGLRELYERLVFEEEPAARGSGAPVSPSA